jgi:hypothetical protein
MLNMVRGDDYDVMLPSITLKIHSELNEKDMSYFELKQLQKTMTSSPKMLNQMMQKFENEYGPEELVQQIRYVMV